METLDTGTGLYDEAFSETVMDAFDFTGSDAGWQCVEGGMDRFVFELKAFLDTKATTPHSSSMGSESDSTSSGTGPAGQNVPSSPLILQGYEVVSISPDSSGGLLLVKGKSGESKAFSHVINTAPLSIQRTMDMSACDLTYKQREAIRTLHYDFSCKVGIKFKTRFWETASSSANKFPSDPIKGGQSSTDNPLRIVVYPSYGVDTIDAAAVMIASYTWAQDASRMGALCCGSGNSADVHDARRDEAIKICLNYLTEIHGEIVNEQYTGEYVVMDWYSEKYAQGAFALFGPGQFTDLFPNIVQPAAQGKLHFAGEATSVHHAWIVGALNSAYRSVWEILKHEGLAEKMAELMKRWGVIDEVEYGDFVYTAATAEATTTAAFKIPTSDHRHYHNKRI